MTAFYVLFALAMVNGKDMPLPRPRNAKEQLKDLDFHDSSNNDVSWVLCDEGGFKEESRKRKTEDDTYGQAKLRRCLWDGH